MVIRNKIYYLFKPFLPWRLRYFARRLAARRMRGRVEKIWPIDEIAGQRPEGWPGWPEGKKFAFLITHDVEGLKGLENCRRIAELEIELGVRSSFNFIPEGSYTVPPDFRAWLESHGFEVGIHDLHHDGKLFDSAAGFSTKAKRINYYLREWGAVGFRAGFMLRNLDWYHELDLQYDSSTFDTDPFEPQPDGTRTIFPFWKPLPESRKPQRPGGNSGPVEAAGASGATNRDSHREGYVELPYTLPQDSTLFLLLNEAGPDIWLRKIDWVAERGGMALVNVHPDYIRFAGEKPSSSTYPVEHYKGFLRYVTQKYSGQFWHPKPRQLAAWFRAACVPAAEPVGPLNPGQPPAARVGSNTGRLAGKRAAVLLYSNYPSDPRPRRAAEAMVEAGMTVDLLCLSQSDDDPREENVNGVAVCRHPMKRRRDSVWTYLWQYSRFGFSSFWFLVRGGMRRKYDVVHVHNMPDFLVFAALVPKLRGARIILDLHDPTPELMTTIFGLPDRHWFVRTLRQVERFSIAFSDLIFTPNITFKDLFVSRSCRSEKVAIVMNSPEPTIFDPSHVPAASRGAESGDGEFRVMHHGLIAHRHGVDLLVAAVAILRPTIPAVRLDIYGGSTPFLEEVLKKAAELGIADIVRYHGSKSQGEIAAAIERCHVGVVPNRRSVFTEINFPTRLFEYLAMQRPVVAPNTRGIRDYFKPDELLTFEPGDVNDLAEKIRSVYQDPERVRGFVARGVAVYRSHLWPEQKIHLIESIAKVTQA